MRHDEEAAMRTALILSLALCTTLAAQDAGKRIVEPPIKKTLAPPAIVRVNGRRAVIVTTAPAAGKTPAEAAAQCVKLAEKVLPRGYRVKDLTGPNRWE